MNWRLINAREMGNKSVLQWAVRSKSVPAVKFLLDHGVEVESSASPINGGPLNWAVESGSKEMVEFLLSQNVGINGPDEHSRPAEDAAESPSKRATWRW